MGLRDASASKTQKNSVAMIIDQEIKDGQDIFTIYI